MAHSQLLTSADEGIDGSLREAGRAVALGIHLQVQVGDGQVLVELVLTVHVNNLAEDAHRAPYILGHLRSSLYGDANDDLGTHLAGNVGRIVVFQTTVHQHHIADSHR